MCSYKHEKTGGITGQIYLTWAKVFDFGIFCIPLIKFIRLTKASEDLSESF